LSRIELKTASPGLLISVRSLDEAAQIVDRGVSVLDLKEPGEGPLAPVTAALWNQVAELHAHQIALSAAMGELDEAIAIAAAVPASFSFAKAGPSNRTTINKLISDWASCRSRLHADVTLVAVAYADYQHARSLPPIEVFQAAAKQGFSTWLVDTFVKDGRSTFEHLTGEDLVSISELAKRTGSRWVLAGSIRLEMLDGLLSHSITPDLIGVRGDVCDQSRVGNICVSKVERWLARVGLEAS
jgi:uncharacterized protein (UPF0264 family)